MKVEIFEVAAGPKFAGMNRTAILQEQINEWLHDNIKEAHQKNCLLNISNIFALGEKVVVVYQVLPKSALAMPN